MSSAMTAIDIEASKFLYSIPEKYPHLKISQALIDAVVSEMKAVGIYRENATSQAFMVGLLAAMENGKLPKAPLQVVERVVEVEAPPPPAKKTPQYAPMSKASSMVNHAHPHERVMSEEVSNKMIARMEASAKLYVESVFSDPPAAVSARGFKNHSESQLIRDKITAIISRDRAEGASWARTAREIKDEIVDKKSPRGIR